MATDSQHPARWHAERPAARRGRWLGLAWRVGRWPVIFYLLIIVLMMLAEDRMVFVPAPYPGGNWHPEGLLIEDAWFDSPDGLRLHGWYVPHAKPRAVVLLCHGNGGNVTSRIEMVQALHDDAGASVLAFDYRGYGRSEGKPNEKGVLADARAARAWLARREGIAEQDIVLLGRSLGGAVAVDLAAADGARALVLQSTFTSAPDVAAWHYWWLPVRPLMRNRFDSAAKIGDYHGPLLVSHGDADRTVPIHLGRRLFELANEPKEFFLVPGGHHDALPSDAYFRKLTEFLEGLSPQEAPEPAKPPETGHRPVRIEESLIFFPVRYPEGDWQPDGLEPEDAWFQAADGVRLHGWYLAHASPRAVVLFSHGNAGNLSHRADTMRVLRQRVGVSVLVYDYRGYGRSEGKPDEKGVLADARAARAWLARRAGIAETDIVQMGRSLGGAVAVDLAAADGARALVLESTFTSMPDVAAFHYRWLPVRLLMHTRFDSLEKIAGYHGPLLVSHGDADTIVPYESGRKLFDAANQPKHFLTIPDGDHNDSQPREYYEKLVEFLDGLG